MKDKKYTTIRITLVALMASMCAALGFVAIDLGNIKITFESLPIIIGGLMFGPVDAVLIGGIGTFIYQVVRYGISPTTVLWIIPYILCGLIVGIYAKKSNFSNSKKQIFSIILISEIFIFILNTLAIFIDSKVYGYFSWTFILSALPIRLLIAIAKSIAFGLIAPKILISFTKITGNGMGNEQHIIRKTNN